MMIFDGCLAVLLSLLLSLLAWVIFFFALVKLMIVRISVCLLSFTEYLRCCYIGCYMVEMKRVSIGIAELSACLSDDGATRRHAEHSTGRLTKFWT